MLGVGVGVVVVVVAVGDSVPKTVKNCDQDFVNVIALKFKYKLCFVAMYGND